MTCVSRRPEVWIVVHVPEQYNFSRMSLLFPDRSSAAAFCKSFGEDFQFPIADRSLWRAVEAAGFKWYRDCHGELLQHPLMIGRQSAGRICSAANRASAA
jgi:hypothetical protein